MVLHVLPLQCSYLSLPIKIKKKKKKPTHKQSSNYLCFFYVPPLKPLSYLSIYSTKPKVSWVGPALQARHKLMTSRPHLK